MGQSTRITVMVDDGLSEQVTDEARACGLSVSAWVRSLIIERLRDGMPPAPSRRPGRVAFDREELADIPIINGKPMRPAPARPMLGDPDATPETPLTVMGTSIKDLTPEQWAEIEADAAKRDPKTGAYLPEFQPQPQTPTDGE